MKCIQCGNVNQPDAVFCDQCGARLAAAPTVAATTVPVPASAALPGLCPQCGAANTPGEMFCGECGAPLDAPAPEASAVLPIATPALEPVAPTATSPAAEAPAPTLDVTPATARTCAQCGAAAEADDAFCAKCGASLAAAPASVAAAPAPSAPATQIAPAVTATATAPTAAALTECPSCGADVTPDDAFCDFCGAALVGDAVTTATAVAAAPSPVTPSATPQPALTRASAGSIAGPHLVVVASGALIPLPELGEALAGREDPLSNTFPEVDLTPHGGEEGGVSRRHFKITLGEGQYALQDLNSTNSTWLNRTRLQPGLAVALHDGDEIRAGRVRLQFRAG